MSDWEEDFRELGGDLGRDTHDYFGKYPEMLQLIRMQGALEEREAILDMLDEELAIESEAIASGDDAPMNKAFNFAIKCAAKWIKDRGLDEE